MTTEQHDSKTEGRGAQYDEALITETEGWTRVQNATISGDAFRRLWELAKEAHENHKASEPGRGDVLARQERMAEDFERLVKIIEAWRTSSHTARWIAQRINEAGLLASPSDLPTREAIEQALVNYDAVIEQHHRLVDGCINKVDEATSELVRVVRAALQPLFQGNGEAVAWQARLKKKAESEWQYEWKNVTKDQFEHPSFGREYRALYAAPPSQPEGVRGALEDALKCFQAAWAEGLSDRLYEQNDINEPGSLADLVERRLLHAQGYVEQAIAALLTTTPSPGLVEAAEWQNKAIIALEAIAKLQGPAIELGPAIASGFFEARTLSAKPTANAADREGDRDA